MTVLTRQEFFEHLNAYNKTPEYQAYVAGTGPRPDFGKLVGQRVEITEAEYWYFLEVLPPVGFTGRSFYMSEFLTEDITSYFEQKGSRYFHEYRRAPLAVQREAQA